MGSFPVSLMKAFHQPPASFPPETLVSNKTFQEQELCYNIVYSSVLAKQCSKYVQTGCSGGMILIPCACMAHSAWARGLIDPLHPGEPLHNGLAHGRTEPNIRRQCCR